MDIKITLSDIDLLALKNDLLDVNGWVLDAAAGKVASCKKRMIAEWMPILISDPSVESLPANEDDIIQLIIARNDYQNRASRDAAKAS